MDIINEAKKVFNIEIKALEKVKNNLNKDFIEFVNIIKNCKGKVIITGMGKSGHVAKKVSATMSSLGIPSFFMHSAEAAHGDLGIITKDDIVIIFSNSGESNEIIDIIPNIKLIGAKIVSITNNKKSTISISSDISYVFPKINEACPFGLAPTSTSTASLVFGDALSIVLSKLNNFGKENYLLFHPAGSLGKKLFIKVKDIMQKDESNSFVFCGETLKNAILEISSKYLSIVSIVDKKMYLKGVITDGDIRRLLEKGKYNILDEIVDNIMTKNPFSVNEDELAVDALKVMESVHKQINSMPVINKEEKLVGTIRVHDIVKQGIWL